MVSVTGTSGSDLLIGTADNDVITGLAGDDALYGGAGADILYGNEGKDILWSGLIAVNQTTGIDDAGLEHDQLFGGDDDDSLNIGMGDDADGGNGFDTLRVSLAGAGAAGATFSTSGFTPGANFNFFGGTISNVEALNYIVGSVGNDVISIANHGYTVTVEGGDGIDLVTATASSVIFLGGNGEDLFVSGSAADTFNGGAGYDTVYYRNATSGVVVDLTRSGAQAGATGDTLISVESVVGSDFGDRLIIGAGQAAYGGGGNDTILADFGGILNGGEGADYMYSGGGNADFYVDNVGDEISAAGYYGTYDRVFVSLAGYQAPIHIEELRGLLTTGQDLSGGADTIVVYGNIGNDTLRLSFAASAYGGLGDDTYYIRSGVPFAATGAGGIFEYAGEGVDTAYISVGNYTLNDHVENMIGMLTTGQTLTGGSTDNVITGNIGNDTLNGGGGADTLIGGLGDDTYIVDAFDTTIENPGEGTDTVRTSIASYTLSANLENLVGTAASGQWLIGNELANAITGTAGNDIIDGRAGADAMNGGAGNDIYYIDNIGDTLQDSSGVDEVRTTLATYNLGSTYYTGAIIENLTGISATGQYLIGTHLANIITGGIGDDIIDGRDGADTMIGGQGNDRYLVDIAGDVVIELAGQGIDEVVTALGSYRLGENLENLIGISSSGQWLAGNALSNTLTGGNGNDVLEGGAGVDSMWGNGGNDRYLVDDPLDQVHEDAGGGTDEVLSYASTYTLSANVENMIGMLTTGQTLIGNELGNVLTGNSGNDVLDGAAGADSLWGYEGDDIYYVDNSGDMVHESSGQGYDQVRSTAASYTLSANVEDLTGLLDTGQTLTGNALSNILSAGNGNDVLYGGAGNDVLIGHGGNDRFVFAPGGGADTVTDFTSGADKLDLSAYGFANYAAVQAAMTDSGANSYIALGGGDYAILLGVNASQIMAGDVLI